MHTLPLILFVGYLAAGPLAWVVFLAGMIHTQRMARMRRPGPSLPSPPPTVAVLMPAKDEGPGVRAAVASVLAQDYPDFDLIAVNDRSRDQTGAVLDELAAAHPSMRVLHLAEGDLPPGWFGKCNALHRASRGLSADWILFVDSDVCLETDALRAAVALAEDRHYDALSLMTRLECHGFWEKLILPTAAAALCAMYRVSATNSDHRRTNAYANGQFMLIRRATYEEAGGHEAVRDHITEDVDLMRAIKRNGRRVRLLWGREFASTRMYDSLSAIFRGWGRIFSGSSNRRPWRILAAMTFILVSCLSVVAVMAWGLYAGLGHSDWGWLILAGAHLGLMIPLLGIVYTKSGNNPLWALAFPLAAMMLLAMYVNALRLCWTGRWMWRGTEFGRPQTPG